MNATFSVVLNVCAVLLGCGVIYAMQKSAVSFSKRVWVGLGLGMALGAIFQTFYGLNHAALNQSLTYIDIIGSGYVKLLQMIVMPLVMVSIIAAILQLRDARALGKISASTISLLLLTTMIAAAIGIAMAYAFDLTAVGMQAHSVEQARAAYLEGKMQDAAQISIPNMLLDFIPANPFLDMAGGRKTSTIAVVIFCVFIGMAALGMADKKPEIFQSFSHFMEVAQAIVMRMVTLVLRLTPYGVLALMTKVLASSNWQDIKNLMHFVFASYSAIAIMFGIHLLIIALTGLNPLRYVQKIMPVLVLAFTSRTSAGAIPLNVQIQTKRLGTPAGIAHFSATFGATMGQNGCAGIYPAMLAFMIAPTVGVNPLDLTFMMTLIGVIAISSIGIAGVGGGATFAALAVLSSLNLPVGLAGLLISIEPLIDMGRTALNVSGAMLAGTVTSRWLGMTNPSLYNAKDEDLERSEVET